MCARVLCTCGHLSYIVCDSTQAFRPGCQWVDAKVAIETVQTRIVYFAGEGKGAPREPALARQLSNAQSDLRFADFNIYGLCMHRTGHGFRSSIAFMDQNGMCSAAQRSAVQCSAVQRSAAQRSAVQWSAVQWSAVQRSVVQCNAESAHVWETLRVDAQTRPHYTALACMRAAQRSTSQHIAAHRST